MNRKRHIIFITIRVLIFIHLFIGYSWGGLTYLVANAQQDNPEETLNQNISEQIENLDLEALEEYVRSLGYLDDKSISERIFAYIQGDAFSYKNLWEDIVRILFAKVKEILPAFACIAAVALLAGIMSGLNGGKTGKTAGEMVYFICYVASLIPLVTILIQCFTQTIRCIDGMQTQMQYIFPVMLTLMAASGGNMSVQLAQPAVAFFSGTIVSVMRSVVIPFTATVLAFSMADKLSKDLKITKFSGFFKSINKWIIGICLSVFGIFFSLHGITSSSYDGIVRRVAKYAIGNGVPIVGGFLSGGFDIAVAGSILIKNSLGSMGIFLMVVILFEPLALLVAVNLLLRLAAAITQPFGDSRISDFLGETAENIQYCTAAILLTAFMYFLSIIILIASSEALL